MNRFYFVFMLIFILCVQPSMFLTNVSASDANLVAYYPFNDTADDESGNGDTDLSGAGGASSGKNIDGAISHHVPGDYNGDGTADIALYRPTSGMWAIKSVSRVYFGGSDDLPVPCDYNGDATTDIGIFRPASGLWAIRALTRVYFGSSVDIPITGDYDGDGSCDMAIFRPGSGLWAVRGITRCYFGSSSDNPVPGDYNGDGSNIIAVFRPGAGLWAMRNVSRIYFGSDSDTGVPGDYNGDGTWEPGIFRPAAGLWTSRGVSRCYYGASGDFPLAGDIDGDGTSDGAIFRPSTGLWAAPSAPRTYYGSPGDIPVFGIRNSSTARPQPPLPERKGKIIGKVTDAETGQPIMGALVSWNPYAPSAATNSSGDYELTFVDPGTHSVTVRLIGYETATQTCVVISGGTTTLNFILEPEEAGNFAGTWVGPYNSTASKRFSCGWCDLNTTGEMTMFMNQSGTEVWCTGLGDSFLTNYYSNILWDCEGSDCDSFTPATQDISLDAVATGDNLDGIMVMWTFTATRTGDTLNGSFRCDLSAFREDCTFSLIKQ